MAELTIEQKRAMALASARLRAQARRGPVDAVARNVGEPFNRGLAATLQLPTDLINAGIRAVTPDEQKPPGVGFHSGFTNTPDRQFQIPADVEGGFRALGLTAPP